MNKKGNQMDDYMKEMQKYVVSGNMKKSSSEQNIAIMQENKQIEEQTQPMSGMDSNQNMLNFMNYMKVAKTDNNTQNIGMSNTDNEKMFENFMQFQQFLNMSNQVNQVNPTSQINHTPNNNKIPDNHNSALNAAPNPSPKKKSSEKPDTSTFKGFNYGKI